MRLIGSLSEARGVDLGLAYVLSWTPDQGEDLYVPSE
jgi:hypothetical protein